MVLEELNILGHVVDVPPDRLYLGVEVLEVGIELNCLLVTFFFLYFNRVFAFVEHINYKCDINHSWWPFTAALSIKETMSLFLFFSFRFNLSKFYN